MSDEDKAKPFYKKGSWGLLLAVLTLIMWVGNWIPDFQNLVCELVGLWVPTECILVPITVAFACVAVIEQLRRRQHYTVIDKTLYRWREKGFVRRLLKATLVLAILLGLVGEYWFWSTRYDLPGAEADIRIFIDQFVANGWDTIDVQQRIGVALRKELNDVLPEATIAFLPPPPGCLTTADDRLDWACNGGATLVIQGRLDEGTLWPEINVCSENVPETKFEDYEAQISKHEVTPIQIAGGGYDRLPDVSEAVRLCFMDSLATPRINYLALFSLGMVFLYDDLPNMTERQALKTSYDLFAKAVTFGPRSQDCQLDICGALYYTGTTACLIAKADTDSVRAAGLFGTADSCFSVAVALRPEFPEALNNWGNALSDIARRQSTDQAGKYFRLSFEKYAEALRIDQSFHVALKNWGDALSDYALRLEGEQAERYFGKSFKKYAEAIKIDSNYPEAYNGWGNAYVEYARASEREIAGQYFDSSFKKYAIAVRLRPDFHLALYNWGNSLLSYASSLQGEQAHQYFRQSIDKYSKAVRIRPKFPLAFNALATAHKSYAQRLNGAKARHYFDSSFQMYAEAVRLDSNYGTAYFNWGSTLVEYARQLEGEEAHRHFEESFEKFAEAVRINPNHREAFNNWGMALSDYAHCLGAVDAGPYFRDSFLKSWEALKINPDYYQSYISLAISIMKYFCVLTGEISSSFNVTITQWQEVPVAEQRPLTCCLELIGMIDRVAESDSTLYKFSADLRKIALELEKH